MTRVAVADGQCLSKHSAAILEAMGRAKPSHRAVLIQASALLDAGALHAESTRLVRLLSHEDEKVAEAALDRLRTAKVQPGSARWCQVRDSLALVVRGVEAVGGAVGSAAGGAVGGSAALGLSNRTSPATPARSPVVVAAHRMLGMKAGELRAQGFSAAELAGGGYREEVMSLVAENKKLYSIADLLAADFSIEHLRRECSFSASDFKAAKCPAADLKAAGFTTHELAVAGFEASELKQIGCGAEELTRAGYRWSQLREARFSASQLAAVGAEPRRLSAVGYSDDELRIAGFSYKEITGS
uniref:Uncharacterized protein n=1 Tax=Haptolina brevifila TaxID=156173 RepID=A0A7S2DK43_9EUKA